MNSSSHLIANEKMNVTRYPFVFAAIRWPRWPQI